MLKNYKRKKRAGDGLKENIMDIFFTKVMDKFMIIAVFYGALVMETIHWFFDGKSYFWWVFIIFIIFILKVFLFDFRKIKKELENKKRGLDGENFVGDFLEENFKNENSRIINDLVLENNGKKFNIDHILINKKGVFIVETKNQNNWIGHEKEQYKKWMIQTRAQIKNLKKITENENIFGMVIRPNLGNRKNFKYDIPIINQKFIKDFINTKEEVFSKKEIEEIYNLIKERDK